MIILMGHAGELWEPSFDVLMKELSQSSTVGKEEPHPVSMWIDGITRLNGEKGPEWDRVKVQ